MKTSNHDGEAIRTNSPCREGHGSARPSCRASVSDPVKLSPRARARPCRISREGRKSIFVKGTEMNRIQRCRSFDDELRAGRFCTDNAPRPTRRGSFSKDKNEIEIDQSEQQPTLPKKSKSRSKPSQHGDDCNKHKKERGLENGSSSHTSSSKSRGSTRSKKQDTKSFSSSRPQSTQNKKNSSSKKK